MSTGSVSVSGAKHVSFGSWNRKRLVWEAERVMACEYWVKSECGAVKMSDTAQQWRQLSRAQRDCRERGAGGRNERETLRRAGDLLWSQSCRWVRCRPLLVGLDAHNKTFGVGQQRPGPTI